MRERFYLSAVAILIVLLAALAGQPSLGRLLYAASWPRPAAARGDLAEPERATISLFERVSPSVVQVVAAAPAAVATDMEGEAGREQSGTGVVWDGAGHVVTNNHVVSGTREV